jgi:GNAT superfamily N-acetyltransferase
MELNVCLSPERLDEVKKLYIEAFPPEERKPFSMIEDKVREGSMEILCMEEEGRFIGLAIMILHGDIALLDYLAVSPERRGNGSGTKTLSLLKERYPEKTLLLEIEDPDEPSDNTAERLRRRDFYFRNGMVAMDYRVWLFGVKMIILTDGAEVPFSRYHTIFLEIFGKKAAQNVSLA